MQIPKPIFLGKIVYFSLRMYFSTTLLSQKTLPWMRHFRILLLQQGYLHRELRSDLAIYRPSIKNSLSQSRQIVLQFSLSQICNSLHLCSHDALVRTTTILLCLYLPRPTYFPHDRPRSYPERLARNTAIARPNRMTKTSHLKRP